MKHFTHLFILVCLFSSTSVFSQKRYRIVYDYINDSIGYYELNENNEITKTLRKPVFRKNGLVEVKLKNVNPFAVKLESKINRQTLNSTGVGFNMGSMLSGIKSLAGDNLSLNVSNLDANPFDIGQGRGDNEIKSYSSTGSNRQLSQKEILALQKQILLNQINSDIREIENIFTSVEGVKANLLTSLINPNNTKERIQQHARQALSIFESNDLAGYENNFLGFLSKTGQVIQDYKGKILIGLEEESQLLELENKQSLNVVEKAKNSALKTRIPEIVTNLDAKSDHALNELNEVKALYMALEAASFERTFDYLVDSDRASIELDFLKNDSSDDLKNDSAKDVVKSRKLNVFMKGGVKVNTSIALALTNYGENARTYFVKDDTIEEGLNDYFVPNLSTMINFYPVIGEGFNIGGSFGVSVPISTDNNSLNGVNFLLGPSLFIGGENRISFSGGIAYGPVNRLKSEFGIGDNVSPADAGNLTQTIYGTGYYFAISFSLFNLTNKN